jgi:hypothetical protein
VTKFDLDKFPSFISRVALSMEGVALVPGIYASMEVKHRYSSVIVKATTIDGLLTILVSVIGFLAYGLQT